MVELLAPAGTYESLRAAVNAGADAVYIGGSRFGARAYADNPEEEALLRRDQITATLHGKKAVSDSQYASERTEELEQQLYDPIRSRIISAGLDGVIVQDFGVVQFSERIFSAASAPCEHTDDGDRSGWQHERSTKSRDCHKRIVPATGTVA